MSNFRIKKMTNVINFAKIKNFKGKKFLSKNELNMSKHIHSPVIYMRMDK